MSMRTLILAAVALLLGGSVPAHSQIINDPTLPVPEIEVHYRAGIEGEPVPEAGIGASIVATVDEEDRCACGARFEARLEGSNEWVTLGLFAPAEDGDEVVRYEWAIVTNLLEPTKRYDIRVQLYDRVGDLSGYGEHSFVMAPSPPQGSCTEGAFSDIEKTTYGSGALAFIGFFWNSVCKNQTEANRYKIYRDGQLVRDMTDAALSAVFTGEPVGERWKIEAYGDEPPDQNNAVIRNCDEVVRKLNARLNDRPTIIAAVRVARLLQCQQVGDLLRTIIEWEPYTHCAVNCDYVSPDFWSFYSAFTPPPNQGHWQPLFNYPEGSFQYPGPPGQNPYEVLRYGWRCRKAGTSEDNPNNGFNNIDPMNQVGWTCPGTWTSGELGPNTVYRQWLNFNLTNISPPSSIWPITTELTY